MRVAIYTRQSLDRSGEALAVSRQEAECRELADRNRWDVAKVYSDNDKSATNGRRPDWEKLLADLRNGQYDVLICWHTDRLYRRLRDLTGFFLTRSGNCLPPVSRFHSSKVLLEIFPWTRSSANLRRCA